MQTNVNSVGHTGKVDLERPLKTIRKAGETLAYDLFKNGLTDLKGRGRFSSTGSRPQMTRTTRTMPDQSLETTHPELHTVTGTPVLGHIPLTSSQDVEAAHRKQGSQT